jgi:hypothetical protein
MSLSKHLKVLPCLVSNSASLHLDALEIMPVSLVPDGPHVIDRHRDLLLGVWALIFG